MRRSRLLLCLGSLLVAGCGAGGDPPDLFVGSYWLFEMDAYHTTSQYEFVGRSRGILHSDGEGGTDTTYTILGESFGGPGTYVLHDDHTLHRTIGAHVEEGGLSTVGRSAVSGRVASGNYSGISVLLTRLGAFDDATLSGSYHMAGFGCTHVGYTQAPSTQAESGSLLSFDGAGHYAATPVTLTRIGWIGQEDAALGLAYAVEPDGLLTMVDLTGSNELTGGILAGGDVAAAIGGSQLEQDPVFYALIRASTGRSDASFRGSYWIVGIQRTTVGFRSFFGEVVADGAGSYWFAGQESREGDLGAADPYAGTYAVAANGALTLTVGDGATLVGGLSRDGDYFTAAGGTAEGDAPCFVFGIPR